MALTPIEKLLRPVNKFIHQEFTGGIVLFVSVIVAIIIANSPWAIYSHHFWETTVSVDFGGNGLHEPLHVWINDGLMALFFFVIGLELKREFMAGELSSPRKAMLPMVAALGGMLVPAGIYLLFNAGRMSATGWGIPMATDIAFALALLSLAGRHIPASIKVFLAALAVADDLGAVLVIAFFYTSHIAVAPLMIGALLLLVLLAGNLSGIRHVLFYLLLGIAVWVCFLFSGVHATIAGVLVAFTIPARTKINEEEYATSVKSNIGHFEQAIPHFGALISPEQLHHIERIKQLSLDAETPLQKIEHSLHPWVAFLIMPLFALANAGMQIDAGFFSEILNPVSAGIFVGLVAGKFIGVLLFTWLMIRSGIATMPLGGNWRHIVGVALLAGVGFTMSLFVTGLAFHSPALIDEAKYGILLASIVAGTAGILVLRTGRTATVLS